MALTRSTMLPLGTPAPNFSLPDVTTGQNVSLADFAGKKALLVMFICRHCPFVKHAQWQLGHLGRDYAASDLGMVAIQANDAAQFPDDAPKSMATMVWEMGFTFPVLHDETQAVAKAYTAACTPDFFLFDESRKLVYRGQLDDSKRSNNRVTDGASLRAAIEAVLHGQSVDPDQKPSEGCNIKWKPGNEPEYFKPE